MVTAGRPLTFAGVINEMEVELGGTRRGVQCCPLTRTILKIYSSFDSRLISHQGYVMNLCAYHGFKARSPQTASKASFHHGLQHVCACTDVAEDLCEWWACFRSCNSWSKGSFHLSRQCSGAPFWCGQQLGFHILDPLDQDRKAPQSTAIRCNLHGIRICTVAFSRESKVILMWAIIAVYWIHPTHKLIIAEKVEDSCEPQGPDAWRGVWYSATWMGA